MGRATQTHSLRIATSPHGDQGPGVQRCCTAGMEADCSLSARVGPYVTYCLLLFTRPLYQSSRRAYFSPFACFSAFDIISCNYYSRFLLSPHVYIVITLLPQRRHELTIRYLQAWIRAARFVCLYPSCPPSMTL